VYPAITSVTPNTDYVFSFYAVDVNTITSGTNATIEADINGIPYDTLNTTGNWQQASFVWNSGSNTTAAIHLTDVYTAAPGNDFALAFISLSPQASTQPPVVSSVSAMPSNGEFGPGSTISLTVNFSEPVTVMGTPTLTLNDSGTATYDPAASAALNDPTKLVFDYTVLSTDTSVPSLAVNAVNLNGATIQDQR
jgi:hypothetical protein